jgi:sarcosine oxidase delta subunit
MMHNSMPKSADLSIHRPKKLEQKIRDVKVYLYTTRDLAKFQSQERLLKATPCRRWLTP